ncbi:hypothetical protein KKA14_19705 [bacterium]|nr:hypothetical protein [bacterium]
MKYYMLLLALLLIMAVPIFGQTDEQPQNAPQQSLTGLEPDDISQQVLALESELADAARQVEYWKGLEFFNDRKRQRDRDAKVVYWAQKTVDIRNKITEIKKDRSYYQHKMSGDKRFYYKR